jgi:hypothetical protein
LSICCLSMHNHYNLALTTHQQAHKQLLYNSHTTNFLHLATPGQQHTVPGRKGGCHLLTMYIMRSGSAVSGLTGHRGWPCSTGGTFHWRVVVVRLDALSVLTT